ncbi:MAG: oligosaccharide flippase family protein, partial [Bacteroidota bacterium]
MKIRHFIQAFGQRKGGYVLFASLFGKLVNFVVAIIVIRLLSKTTYGLIAYAFTIVSFIVPFMGAGIQQSLLRFGALCQGQNEKKLFFRFALRRGLSYSALLLLCLLILTPFITSNLPDAAIYLAILGGQLIGLLVLQLVEIYCRLLHLNKLFSKIEIINSLSLLISNTLACWLFGGLGYVVSLVSIPLLVGGYFLYRLGLHDYRGLSMRPTFDAHQLIRYGLYMSLGGVLSQLLYAVDILIIGNVLQAPDLLAQYKASSIIPFNLLILPVAMM